MKYFCLPLLLLLFNSVSCNSTPLVKQEDIKNEKLKAYKFLKCMYSDSYFPKFLVDKGKAILIELCLQIEKTQPKNLAELYKLTHTSTKKFNALQDEFYKNNSEIETAARECIALDFEFIAKEYGFDKADVEELIAPREW